MSAWPVRVPKAKWDELSRRVKEAKQRGERGAELCAVVVQWEGRNVPLRWGPCGACGLAPTRAVRGRVKCLLCGAKVLTRVGDAMEEVPGV